MEVRELADYEVPLSANTGGQAREPDGCYTFVCGICNENHELGRRIFAVNRLEIVRYRTL
jgi:hypothetical protein